MSLSLLVVAVSTVAPAPAPLLSDVAAVIDEVELATPAVLWGHWRPLAAIHDPAGRDPCPRTELGIFLTGSAIWIGRTAGANVRIDDIDGARDWDGLAEMLHAFKESSSFADRDDIELTAAEGAVAEDVARAMRLAREAGFVRVEYVPPGFESVEFEPRIEHRFPLQTVGLHSVAIAASSHGALVSHDDGRVEWFPRRDLGRLARELRRWRRGASSYAVVHADGRGYDDRWLETVRQTVREAGYRWTPHVRDWPSAFANAGDLLRAPAGSRAARPQAGAASAALP